MLKHTCLFLLGGAALLAQPGTAPAVEDRSQMVLTAGRIGAVVTADTAGAEVRWLAEEVAGDARVVTGAPYSASAVTETVQTLADGNHIRHTTTSSVARDSQGRTRREQSLSGLTALTGNKALPNLIFIQDPVAKTHYVLQPDTKIARTGPGGPVTIAPPPGSYQMKIARSSAPGGPESEIRKESLGSQVINGVRADGNRVTRTIAAGEIGNERPIEIVTETWYSPDLQATVRSKTSDPRMGDTTFELQNIDRSEPAPALFTVPADYTVQDGGEPTPVVRHAEVRE